MTLPDNRIRFSPSPINFETEVGITGQDHDLYPKANTQARFDWMRMVLIGLLSNQSSYTEPTEFREGTVWYDLNEQALKIRMNDSTGNGAWEHLSEAIFLKGSDGTTVTLGEFYRSNQ